MPPPERGAEGTAVIARRRLHPHVLERAFAQQSPVGDAVQRHAAGHRDVLGAGLLLEAAGHVEPDLFGPLLKRSRDVLVPLLDLRLADAPGAAENREAWQSLMAFDKPFITAFSDKDPITAGADAVLRKLIPGCQGQPHTTIENGGHFLQEDQGEALARVLTDLARGA